MQLGPSARIFFAKMYDTAFDNFAGLRSRRTVAPNLISGLLFQSFSSEYPFYLRRGHQLHFTFFNASTIARRTNSEIGTPEVFEYRSSASFNLGSI
jgi:hypothetical protein